MLARLASAQASTTNSLQAAQDFAANAAHELRTPLTAMRADLDTLRIHDLPAEERQEVVADLSRAQRRVEAIITALGQLASGQLAQAADREPIDVAELLERVARENSRPSSTVEVELQADDAGTIMGWPGGLRLAVDNLVRNAMAHGQATRVVLAAYRRDDHLDIIVDDNGCGLPAEEHQNVLGRFARGSTAASGGSGLGLALVAQQAALHDGGIELSDGPLGGLRATLTVSTLGAPEDRRPRAAAARQPSSSAAVTVEATITKVTATPPELSLRNTIPTAIVHTQTATPVGTTASGSAPSAAHEPADSRADQKRPRGLRDAGDGHALGVASPADRAEREHAYGIGCHCRPHLPARHAVRPCHDRHRSGYVMTSKYNGIR